MRTDLAMDLPTKRGVAATIIAGAEDDPTYQRLAKWGDLTHHGHGDAIQIRITNKYQFALSPGLA